MTDDEIDEIDETLTDDAALVDDEDAVQEPPDGQVVFLNDDYTTGDFVVQVLMEIFHKTKNEAAALMLEVDNKGKAVIGVYALDVAVTRSQLAIKKARGAGYPLQVKVFTLPAGGFNGGSK